MSSVGISLRSALVLKQHGFDGLSAAVAVFMNAAMAAERSEYLQAEPCERYARSRDPR